MKWLRAIIEWLNSYEHDVDFLKRIQQDQGLNTGTKGNLPHGNHTRTIKELHRR